MVRCFENQTLRRAEGHACTRQALHASITFDPQRRIVPRVDVGQFIFVHIEHGVDSRHEHTLLRVRDQEIVDAFIASAGELVSITAARTRVRVSAMKRAAGTPLSATSAMNRPSRLSGKSNTS